MIPRVVCMPVRSLSLHDVLHSIVFAFQDLSLATPLRTFWFLQHVLGVLVELCSRAVIVILCSHCRRQS